MPTKAETERTFKSLVQECTSEILFGAAAGALSFGVIGYQMWRTRGAVAGAIVGAVLGAFSGLDSALPAPRRTISELGKGPVMGPFRSGATFLFAALAFVLLGFYVWGNLTLECARGDGGVLCSRVTTGWLNNAETSRTDYGPVVEAYEGGRDQIVIVTPEGHRGVIEGFDLAVLAQLTAFLESADATLVASSNSLAMAPAMVWAVAAAVGLLGAWSLRNGTKALRKVLSEGGRAKSRS